MQRTKKMIKKARAKGYRQTNHIKPTFPYKGLRKKRLERKTPAWQSY